jgi:predicted RNA-binding Zn-ribbon protein involved in translation (DUF1610 family)
MEVFSMMPETEGRVCVSWQIVKLIAVSKLRYKAESVGAEFHEVDPRGTSQTCSRCGSKVEKSLVVRTHKCPFCGLVIDRDVNAAINILNTAGRAGIDACGDTASTSEHNGSGASGVVESGTICDGSAMPKTIAGSPRL